MSDIEAKITKALAVAANEHARLPVQGYDSHKEITFRIGDTNYRDTWVGEDPFWGEEEISLGGKVVWIAQYRGRTVDPGQHGDALAFLNGALLHHDETALYRGPSRYVSNRSRYVNKSEGTLEWFKGEEKIWLGRKAVYRGTYDGGRVKA